MSNLLYRNTGLYLRLISAIFLLGGVTGCARVTVGSNIDHQPNSPQAAQLRNVAVLPFIGPHADQFTAQFEAMISQVDEDGKSYFSVADRRNLSSTYRLRSDELRMVAEGRVDRRTAARLRQMVGAEAVYSGQVTEGSVNATPYSESRQQCNAWRDTGRKILGIPVRECTSQTTFSVSCSRVTARFTVVPRLLDLTHGQVVYSATRTGEVRDEGCLDHGPRQDGATLLGQAIAEALRQIRQDIAPWREHVEIALKESTDGLSSEPARTTFNMAIAMAKGGSLTRACDLWRQIESQGQMSVPLSYNLAVCDEVSGHYDQALNRAAAIVARTSDRDTDNMLLRLRARVGRSLGTS